MSDITLILEKVEQGETQAVRELLPLVYDELRRLAAARMAREKPGHTLEPTALVHEAFLRLVGPANKQGFENRRHFYAAVAEAMRRILIDQARRKSRVKHGGGVENDADLLDELPIRTDLDISEMLAIHEALEGLAQVSPRKAELVKLRYFLSCTVPEAASLLGIAIATAEEDWRYAKAWLYRHLHDSEKSEIN